MRPVNGIHAVVLFGAALLAGCPAQKVYEVGGIEFCVPREHLVPDVPWVRPDRPGTPKGFAFQGCWPRASDKGCPFPSGVHGGVVLPSSSFKGWNWEDFQGSLIGQLPFKKGTSFDSYDGGTILVVSNKRVDWNWYVWRKTVAAKGHEHSPVLAEGDELLAVCHVPSGVNGHEVISCNRHVQGRSYALQYTFESKDRVPVNLENLDAQIFKQIDLWRCPK